MNRKACALTLVHLLVVIALVASLTSGPTGQAASVYACSCRSLFSTTWDLSSVAYGDGQFVAVGLNGTILTSVDGKGWVSRCAPTQDDLWSVAFGNGRFVAVGSGTLLSSTNGVDWDQPPAIGGYFNGISYGNGQFVAVDASGAILSSADGWNWATRQSGAQFLLTGIAGGRGQFVAVSDGGHILTSSDGLNWIRRQSGTTADLATVAYGDGRFVAVSFVKIFTSTNGIDWVESWSSDSDQHPQLIGVGYVNGLWMAVGAGGPGPATILTSTDGVVWAQSNPQIQGDVNGSLRSVAYGNGRFVLVGGGGTILTSSDAVSWVQRQAGGQNQNSGNTGTNELFVAGNGPLDTWRTRYQLQPSTPIALQFLAYVNGQFVAVGTTSSETSTDGVNWVLHQPASRTNGLYVNGMVYGNGQFVGVAAGGLVYTSADGVNWVSYQTQAANLSGVGYGNGSFVAVGQANGGILTSADGINWVQRESPTNGLIAVAYGNGLFVAVGYPGTVVTSTDGTNWLLRQSGTGYALDAITFGNGRFVAVERAGGGIVTSSNGINWASIPRVADGFTDVEYGAGLFVALGYVNSEPNIYTSTDGVNWTQHPNGTADVSRVTYGNGQFVLLGVSGTILTSVDGTNWVIRQPAMPRNLYGIGYGDGQFVAAGDFGTILSSADGWNWTRKHTSTQDALFAIAYGNGRFVAVGEFGTILSSADGTTWVEQQTGKQYWLSGVAYGNGRFVAVGWQSGGYPQGAILTSEDGLTWGVRQVGAGYWTVTYGNGQFVAVGRLATMATSSDGVNWAVCEPGAPVDLNSIAYGNGKFVAVGGRYISPWGPGYAAHSDTALITSSDGIHWAWGQPNTTNVFSHITYGYGQFIALAGDTLLTSADGVQWAQRNTSVSPGAMVYGNGQFLALGAGGTILGSGQPGTPTGSLGLWIDVGFTNVAPGYSTSFSVWHTGTVSGTVWDFGDGTRLTNHTSASHAWSAPGTYTIRLTAFNDDYPSGVGATTLVTVGQPVSYVNPANPNPVRPYASWETAATAIQDAIGLGSIPGRLVLVTNGVYRLGALGASGNLSRIALTNQVVVRSVNGPDVTVIEGDTNGVRCAYVGDGSVLSGFTLTSGSAVGVWPASGGGGVCCEYFGIVTNCTFIRNAAQGSGGAVYGGTLYNCTFTGNSSQGDGGAVYGGTLLNCRLTSNVASFGNGGAVEAARLFNCTVTSNSAVAGGGASLCTTYNCVISSNSASVNGGGTFGGTLFNCTLSGNSAQSQGGGAYGGTLNNCIAYFNSAGSDDNNYVGGTLKYCCTTPLPTNGLGNITNRPLFFDPSNGNLRLQANSPCINAGTNAYVTGSTDLDGSLRIAGGTVDIGAYEFQSPASVISYAWLQQYGFPSDGSADFADADGDGLNNWQEWRCGTDPANALSALRLLSASSTATNATVTWQSVAGVNYLLERATNLALPPVFSPLATGIPGRSGTTTYLDTTAVGAGPYFYRIGVGN